MPCLDPNEITELAFAQANGEKPTPPLAARLGHVRHCAQCRLQLDQHVELIQQLKGALQNVPATDACGDCLDDNTLSEFLEHQLDALERQQAEIHLAQCQNCLRQLLDLCDLKRETGLSADEPEAGGPFQVVIGVLANGLLRLLGAPSEGVILDNVAPVPVLGPPEKSGGKDGTPAIQWTQLAGGLKMKVTVVNRGRDTMDVQIHLDPPINPAQLTVRSKSQVIFSEPFNAAGVACVSSLQTGTYDCAIENGPGAASIFRLQIVRLSLS